MMYNYTYVCKTMVIGVTVYPNLLRLLQVIAIENPKLWFLAWTHQLPMLMLLLGENRIGLSKNKLIPQNIRKTS